MTTVLSQPYVPVHPQPAMQDRPAWIPDDIGDNWDTHPYAYQTEEELMPAGIYHNEYLLMITQMLSGYIHQQGWKILYDVFVFYRNEWHSKTRTAPDLMLVPNLPLTPEMVVRSYDLEQEPTPICIFELISPKSYTKDLIWQRDLYASWGVPEYVVLDIMDSKGNPRSQAQCTIWRLAGNTYVPVVPDREGYFTLTSIGIKIRTVGRQTEMRVIATNEKLHTKEEEARLRTKAEARAALEARLKAAEARLKKEAEARAKEAETRADLEAQRARAAEALIQQLQEELYRLRAPKDNDKSDTQ
jgi:Uma2 family endonuclease